MKRSELYYRRPQNDSYQPRNRTSQPAPRGSLDNEAEDRIVALYTSGHSIEAITREVGRARHRVVHILQARGVFGNKQAEPDCEVPGSESLAVEELTQAPAIEGLDSRPSEVGVSVPEIAVEEPPEELGALDCSPVEIRSVEIAVEEQCEEQCEELGALDCSPVEIRSAEIAVEEAPEELGHPTECESAGQLKSMSTEKPAPTASCVEEPPQAERWSPQVAEALCKVILQFNLYPEMSFEDVRKMVSDSNRRPGLR